METYLIYIGKVALAAGAFYIAFLLLFQNQKHFVFNRIYLPVSLAVSFVIPIVTFTTIKYIEPINFDTNSFAFLAESTEVLHAEFVWEWYHYLFGLYIIGVAGFLLHLLLGHFKAIKIIQKSRVQKIFESIVNITKKDVHPFSFFNKIVLSEKTLSHPDLEMIVSHEKIHVQEKHTLDILFAEILFLFQWFNPFAWLIKDAVKNNLEYLTDNEIAKHYNPKTYQLAMVTLADKQGIAPFLTALNGSQLKNRIIMMKKKTENKHALLKQLVVLPLLAVLVMGLSNKEVKTEIVQSNKKIEIFVDGKLIPTDHQALKSIESAKTFDSGEISRLLDIDDKVISNTLVIDEKTGSSTLYIKTSDYVEGINSEFDKITSTDTIENPSLNSGKINHAIDVEIVSEEEAKNVNGKQLESLKENKNSNSEEIKATGYANAKTQETQSSDFKISGPFYGVTKQGSENAVFTPSSPKGLIIKSYGDDSGLHPLYLVNGLETEDVNLIAPENIESISVLKDKSSTALYGEKGKNRVVLITTKNAEKNNSNEIKDTIKVVGYGTQIRPTTVDSHVNAANTVFLKNKNVKNAPLYIVDGIEVENIEYLHPESMASINVLKDKSATALYGEKGKNGVVLITTKNVLKNNSNQIKDTVKVVGYGSTLKGRSIDQTNGFDFGSFKNVPPSGNPVIIVDGQRYNSVEHANVQPDDIANISVLKNESASTKIYGEQAKNGVIVINTKTKYNSEKAKPLILVDGKETGQKIEDIESETIYSVYVLKDESATEKYGEKGKNGVIEIILKSDDTSKEIKSIYDMRKFIAWGIKYPVAAQENRIEESFEIYAFINNDGQIERITERKPDGKYVNIDEVVVTGLGPKTMGNNINKEDGKKLLQEETKRVLGKLPNIKIPELSGKMVAFRFKFVLE